MNDDDMKADLLAALWPADAEALQEYPDGFLRPVLPGEAEAMGVPTARGVVVTPTREGFVIRFAFTYWADLEGLYADDAEGPPWSPAQVAEALGCSLRDLGVLGPVDDD